MKILLLTDVFPPRRGGSGRWLWELYRRLPDFDVHVVAGDAPGAEAFDRASTLPITRVPLSFSSWGVMNIGAVRHYGGALLTLNRVISRVRSDVIHCGKCLPEGLLATALKHWRGLPFTCFVHGEELTLAAASRELTGLTRKVLRECSLVVANSRHSRDLLMSRWGVPDDRIVVMHPGVDTTEFAPAPVDPAVRARLGWVNRRVILTVGALQKRKGQDMMIRALPAIRERFPDVLYSMVGEGWERSYLDNLVVEHGVADVVQFRGVDRETALVDCYQQCDVFALPNRQVGWDFEGFGIVLLEAQACGKPVIAGSSGGTAETIKPSETGRLVACEEPEALASAVSELLGDPALRARMGARGREWVRERFDWTVLTAQAGKVFGR